MAGKFSYDWPTIMARAASLVREGKCAPKFTLLAAAVGVPRVTFDPFCRRIGLTLALLPHPDKWPPIPVAAPVAPRIVREVIDVYEEHRLRTENKRLRRELDQALSQQTQDKHYQEFIGEIARRGAAEAPEWTRRPRSKKPRQAMPVAFLSDCHFDERVFPEQVGWVNGYDREIAEARLERFFRNAAELALDYLHGLDYPGITLPMGGDMFSGNIHDELKQTNEGTIMDSVLHWLGPVEAGIKLLANAFGHVFIPVVVGNHPRNTPKPVHKMKVRDNFDWLFARLLERNLAGDKRVTFQVSESSDCQFNIFSTRFLLTHGDQFRGGSGIAGLLSPMMIGDARKRKRAQAVGKAYDYLIMGHWHQLTHARGVVINGSICGYNEYAYDANFDFEKPRQAFWLVDPDQGLTVFAPIHVLGKDEPWMKGK